jgi:hypothetical protein
MLQGDHSFRTELDIVLVLFDALRSVSFFRLNICGGLVHLLLVHHVWSRLERLSLVSISSSLLRLPHGIGLIGDRGLLRD